MDFPRAQAVIADGASRGLHIGAQVYVAQSDTVLWDYAWGLARPDLPMATNTVMIWLSSSKPLTSTAIAQQVEQGNLDWDDPVVEYIPEFAANGKDAITIRHLLTHTCGFRFVDTGWPEQEWSEILRRICACHLEKDWVPGQRAGYHATSSWYLLGEIIQRISHQTLDDYLQQHVFGPCGMAHSWITRTPEQLAALAPTRGILQRTGKPDSPKPMHEDSDFACARLRPGGGGHGPIRELGQLYHMFLSGGQGKNGRVLKPETVALMTSRVRQGMYDESFKQQVDWGLGIAVNSYQPGKLVPYQFSQYASRNTFGHGGMQSSLGMCDPERKLVIAAVFNGTPGEVTHNQRMDAFLTALYEDLGK